MLYLDTITTRIPMTRRSRRRDAEDGGIEMQFVGKKTTIVEPLQETKDSKSNQGCNKMPGCTSAEVTERKQNNISKCPGGAVKPDIQEEAEHLPVPKSDTERPKQTYLSSDYKVLLVPTSKSQDLKGTNNRSMTVTMVHQTNSEGMPTYNVYTYFILNHYNLQKRIDM